MLSTEIENLLRLIGIIFPGYQI